MPSETLDDRTGDTSAGKARSLFELGRTIVRRVDAEAAARLPSAAGALGDGPSRSDLHDERTAAILGIALGICFVVCFFTGIYSHLDQHPPSWWTIPPAPAGLYRLTQGVHIATGIASIPLLFAKLWTVWPRFIVWPPVSGVANAVERISLLALVGGGLFQLLTGVSNIFHWYWFHFYFTTIHYDAAWVTIGGLLTHILAKLTITRSVLSKGAPKLSRPSSHPGLITRRGFLWTTGAASVTLTVATVGETLGQPIPLLQATDLLGPRRPDTGPQGFPVNRPAVEAGVTHLAEDLSAYRFRVEGPGAPRPIVMTYDQMRAMPRYTTVLPISCVEGWSVNRSWAGLRVVDLLDAVGAAPGATVTVESVESNGVYRTSQLNHDQARDPSTLLALTVAGEILSIDHGYPLRLIAPNRPGVLQTKWVQRLVVS